MLFLRNRTLSFSDPAETSNANGDGSGRRRSAEAAAAAATTTAAAAAAAAAADASAPPQRSRRPFGRVASWVQEVPAEPSSKSESGKPPLAPPPPTANKPSSSSTSTSAPPPSRLLPLPSLPWWQRLVFKGLVATRAAATNDKVLIMRTLTQEVAVPGAPCNGDYLAKRFREARCSSVGRDVSLKLLSAVGLRKSYWKSYASVVDRLLPGNYRYLDARVRFFDGAVKEAVGACCGCSQVVALAAGFDSRGTRFLADPNGEDPDASSSSDSSPLSKKPAPLLRIFEVDLPEVVAGKRKLLADLLPDEEKWPRPELVAADLSDAAKACETLLSAPGFDRRARTLFTAEGLFMYGRRRKREREKREGKEERKKNANEKKKNSRAHSLTSNSFSLLHSSPRPPSNPTPKKTKKTGISPERRPGPSSASSGRSAARGACSPSTTSTRTPPASLRTRRSRRKRSRPLRAAACSRRWGTWLRAWASPTWTRSLPERRSRAKKSPRARVGR